MPMRISFQKRIQIKASSPSTKWTTPGHTTTEGRQDCPDVALDTRTERCDWGTTDDRDNNPTIQDVCYLSAI